jgi:hypothetical protein
MKKLLILTGLVVSQLAASMALAGVTRFDSTQFNDIIAENQKQEKELRHKLQNEAGIDYKIKKTPLHIDRKEVIGEAAEQIAVSSSQPVLTDKTDRSIYPNEHQEMKRLSQEFDQAGR